MMDRQQEENDGPVEPDDNNNNNQENETLSDEDMDNELNDEDENELMEFGEQRPETEGRNHLDDISGDETFESYDIEQTDNHSYLGELHENHGSLRYSVPGTVIDDVYVFYCEYFVPAPNQVFPLRIRASLRHNWASAIPGICVLGHDDDFGVSVQILKYSEQEGRPRMSNLTVFALQRVKILQKSYRMYADDIVPYYIAKIKILHEHNRDPVSVLKSQAAVSNLTSLSSLISIPLSGYKNLDSKYLMSEIQDKLKLIFVNFEDIRFPPQPAPFSFFVLNFFPFPKNAKSFLIKIESTIERLLYLRAIVSTRFTINCTMCHHILNTSADLIQMKLNSGSCVFANPFGFVFELYPMKLISSVVYDPNFRSEFSWFPEYLWSYSSCRVCSAHVGWVFRADNPNLRPQIFTTVSTKSVQLNFEETDNHFINKLEDIFLDTRHTNSSVDYLHGF